MRKVSTSHPPGIHLKTAKNDMQINTVSTVSTSTPEIGWDREKSEIRGPKTQKEANRTTMGFEVDTVDTAQPRARPKTVMIALGEPDHRGVEHRVGETHHNARLSDADVEQIRDEYEAGLMGYRALAKRWGVGKRTIRDIVNFNRRNAWAAKWKRVEDR